MNLLDRRLLLVLGKGGVGKTTVATALALAASKNKRVLLAMVDSKERVSELLGTPSIGDEIVRLRPNLDAVNMRPDAALREYGMMILKIRAVYNAIFENRLVRAFLRGTPGLAAWSMLGKAFFHAAPPKGPADYDLVIIDAQATGHSLDMLRVPLVITKLAPPGLLRREADRAIELLRDSTRSGAVIVSLAEDMPVNESIELANAITNELGISVLQLVINQTLPELFTDTEREFLEQGAAPDALHPEHESAVSALAESGRRRALREQLQRESIALLTSTIHAPFTLLPRRPNLAADRRAIDEFSTLVVAPAV